MLFLENVDISLAISTSLILDSAAVKFSDAFPKLFIECSKRFCIAPKYALPAETVSNQFSTIEIALLAPACVPKETAPPMSRLPVPTIVDKSRPAVVKSTVIV